MSKIILITLTFLAIFNTQKLIGQETEIYSKIKISLDGKDIHELEYLGLEADHGHHHNHRSITNYYSASELKILDNAGFEYKVIIKDVKAYYAEHGTMDESYGKVLQRRLECNNGNDSVSEFENVTPENYSQEGTMGGYLTYDQALAELDRMAALFPNLITQRIAIDDILTEEGRALYYMILSDNPNQEETEEPQIFYNSLHHAREPNSLSQLIFYMWYLLENYETNPEVQYLVNESAMYFMPIINPDGYVYNETTDPQGGGFWRKNRNPNADGSFGVDLNRNYAYDWGADNIGSSPNPTSDIYRGTAPFSEPETQAVRNLCEANNFQIALNTHTFGNLLIYPFGNGDLTPDDDLFVNLSSLMSVDNNFIIGTGVETLGATVNGDSDDWMYAEIETKNRIFSITPEVGNTFWPAPDQILNLNRSTLRQNLNAAHYLHNYGSVIDLESNEIILATTGDLNLELIKSSFLDGTLSIRAISNTPELSFENESIGSFDLANGETQDIGIIYSLDENFAGEEISFSVFMDNGTFEKEFTFTRQVDLTIEQPTFVSTNPIETLDAFEVSGEWGLDDSHAISPIYSLGDSPNGNYSDNSSSSVFFDGPIEMGNAISASLNFYVRFRIEESFDYARLMVSRDGQNFNPICGLYTNPAVEEQAGQNGVELGDPIYDGNQDWVLESIDLSDYLGEENLQFRFDFFSDFTVNDEGFNIDDLSFQITEAESTSTNNQLDESITIFPNPAQNTLNVWFNSVLDNPLSYQIVNTLGQEINNGSILSQKNAIAIQHLDNGIYTIRLFDMEGNASTQKFIKI